MSVPFLDLHALHGPMRAEIRRTIDRVLDGGEFSGGAEVTAFENDFAEYCGTKHAIGVGSGTDALWLALAACDIGRGDEVITVPMSFFATAEAISLTGATPIFVDIDPVTYTMDPEALESAITPRTRAIVPVHLFGQIARMDSILAIAAKHGLRVIEDAAQSHGATYQGKKAGAFGDAACYSFYPAKNLGALGEAGAVVTHDDDLARKIRVLANHGQTRKNHHAVLGWNSRMDGIQGAILRVKLRHLDRQNAVRRDHASAYGKLLASHHSIILPAEVAGSHHVYHIHAIQVQDRPRLIESFTARGIGYGIHYPVPIHLQPAYDSLGYRRGDFPVAENCAARFLSLPMSPTLDASGIAEVCTAIHDTLSVPAVF